MVKIAGYAAECLRDDWLQSERLGQRPVKSATGHTRSRYRRRVVGRRRVPPGGGRPGCSHHPDHARGTLLSGVRRRSDQRQFQRDRAELDSTDGGLHAPVGGREQDRRPVHGRQHHGQPGAGLAGPAIPDPHPAGRRRTRARGRRGRRRGRSPHVARATRPQPGRRGRRRRCLRGDPRPGRTAQARPEPSADALDDGDDGHPSDHRDGRQDPGHDVVLGRHDRSGCTATGVGLRLPIVGGRVGRVRALVGVGVGVGRIRQLEPQPERE